MLPKKHRLGRQVVSEVLRGGRSIFQSNLTLKYSFSAAQPALPPAFAFVVSARPKRGGVKDSVGRHRLKRRARGVIQKLLFLSPASFRPGSTGVFILKKDLLRLKPPELTSHFVALLHQAGIMNG